MSTVNCNFVLIPTGSAVEGGAIVPAPAVLALSPDAANAVIQGVPGALFLDKPQGRDYGGLATAGFAKNGCAYLTLTGTTPVTLDLTALAPAAGVVVAGDAAFGSTKRIRLFNNGAADVVLSPGGSNPANLGFGGTSPTLRVPAGSYVELNNAAGNAVDSTHKTVTVTPTAGGSCGVCVGGS